MNVIWNFNGVIVDAKKAFLKCWIKAIDKFANKLVINQIEINNLENSFGCNDIDIAQKIKFDFKIENTIEIIVEFWRNEFKKTLNRSYLNSDALAFFSSCKKNNFKNYLITDSPIEIDLIKDWGLEFDGIISSTDISQSKPNIDFFLKCIFAFSINPSQVLIIENSLNGIIACEEIKRIFSTIRFINYKNEQKPNCVSSLQNIKI